MNKKKHFLNEHITHHMPITCPSHVDTNSFELPLEIHSIINN